MGVETRETIVLWALRSRHLAFSDWNLLYLLYRGDNPAGLGSDSTKKHSYISTPSHFNSTPYARLSRFHVHVHLTTRPQAHLHTLLVLFDMHRRHAEINFTTRDEGCRRSDRK